MKITFQFTNAAAELSSLTKAVESMARQWGLTDRQLFEVNLILEELCVNVMHHGRQPEGKPINIEIEKDRDVLVIILTDEGQPFDPTSVPTQDTAQPLAGRKAGGLGIHLVRQFTRSMEYRREQGKNIITLRKSI
jgi:anti-sigma regulatory factor (Ser/Thr protein kinase)